MQLNLPIFNQANRLKTARQMPSPYHLLLSLAVLIFLAETITMGILYFLPISNYLANTLLDAAIMVVLIFPGLYFFQMRPILKKVADQEKAELALRTSEAHLRKILETLPVGVWIVNQHGDITHGNRAGQEIWAGVRYVGINGYREYKSHWADTGEPVKPEDWAATRAITRGETVINEEINIEAFDGTQKIILNSAVPLYSEIHEIQGAVVVNQEITQSRKMERDSLRTNALLDRFFDSIRTLIAYLDRDSNFLRVNQAYAEASGHPVEFFTGKNHFDLYPHPENQAIFRQVVETGQPYIVFEKPFEYSEYPERGVTYWDWTLLPVLGTEGQVEGLVLSLVDVSRQKKAEIKLEKQNRELLELTRTEHKQRVLAEGLLQSVIALNSSLELDLVLHTVLEQTRKAIPFQGADILLIEGNTWQVAACLGFENYPNSCPDVNEYHTFDGYPLLQQIRTSLQILVLDFVDEHPGWRADRGMTWVRSFAAVPLILNNKVIGMIELYSEQSMAFDQETAERLAVFAAPAALALHNARLYNAESKARQAAETMTAAAQALSETLDLDRVIDTLLHHIRFIINCETCALTLMEDEGRWTMRAVQGNHTWGDQAEIPTVSLEEIQAVQDIHTIRQVLILPNPGWKKAGALGRIMSWAILPIIASENVIGFVELGNTGEDAFRHDQLQWAEVLVVQASVAIQNAWLFEQVRSSSVRLQSLARKLVDLQEKERYNIARELHDEAGQVLSSLKLSLGRLEQDPDCPAHIARRLLECKKAADGVLEDLHRLAMDLRPVALDHLGLVAALQQLASHINAEGLTVKFKALGIEERRLPQEVETSLYRIVQEALANVLQHAHASNVGILLEHTGAKLKLFVEDDGVGFEADQANTGEQLGLVGMRERAEMLGGSLTIESSTGNGTSVIVEVPDANTDPDYG